VVVGKGDADGRDIHLADILKQKPFIYPIAFKSAVFSMLLISVYLFEEVLVGLWNGKTFADSMPVIGGGSLKGYFLSESPCSWSLCPFLRCGRLPGISALMRCTRRFSYEELNSFRFNDSGLVGD